MNVENEKLETNNMAEKDPVVAVEKDQKLEKEKDQKAELKYSDADVDEIINRKFAKWQEEQEKKIAEAEKLAKMDADEKEKYERERLEKELALYKQREQRYGLAREASKILAENDIVADDRLLDVVVKDTADETYSAVNAFIALVNEHIEKGVKLALSGKSPKANIPSKAMSKESIMAVKDNAERQQLIKDNIELFK